MEQSILKSTKKVLHVDPDDPSFDLDIITQINSAFSTLNDLGVGPADGFEIVDDGPTWTDYLPTDKTQRNQVKTFVWLASRLGFDPPATSFLIDSAKRQLEEQLVRISIRRENKEWVDPNPAPVVVEDV